MLKSLGVNQTVSENKAEWHEQKLNAQSKTSMSMSIYIAHYHTVPLMQKDHGYGVKSGKIVMPIQSEL